MKTTDIGDWRVWLVVGLPYLIAASWVGGWAYSRGRSGMLAFLYSLLLTPVVGAVIVALTKPDAEKQARREVHRTRDAQGRRYYYTGRRPTPTVEVTTVTIDHRSRAGAARERKDAAGDGE